MSISLSVKGDWKKTKKFFQNAKELKVEAVLNKYGEIGVRQLMLNTPKDTGKTANSWRYEIVRGKNTISLVFVNDNVNKGVNIAILLQYGHGTRNGGYVAGRDYINPSLQPLFDILAESAWEEVTS